MAGDERGEVGSPSPELSSLMGVGEQLGVALRGTDHSSKF